MPYDQLNSAIDFAIKHHANQNRDGKDALPYITHPIEVVSNLRYIGQITAEDVLIAAALHDVVEEGTATIKEIELLFGTRIISLVRELTRVEPSSDQTTGLSKEQITRLRGEMLLSEIAAMTTIAQTIKLADRLSNLRAVKATRQGKNLDRYLKQTEKILDIIPKSVNSRLWKALKSELP